ncbi:hypothetical protein JTE90_006323 [Oedothorax gibbosus]|uniref:Uncharacterized protein n=1 Tax=Oedothorax gibbosus TaxID=931172 RepID=A0AAV6U1Y0_9ARAC|nr:hypothetical protein JTE90_006323 [Oedothorax gibbosus]
MEPASTQRLVICTLLQSLRPAPSQEESKDIFNAAQTWFVEFSTLPSKERKFKRESFVRLKARTGTTKRRLGIPNPHQRHLHERTLLVYHVVNAGPSG